MCLRFGLKYDRAAVKWVTNKNKSDLFRIPDRERGTAVYLKNGQMCLDTMGRKLREAPGVYQCHQTGGNQVRSSMIIICDCCSE